MPDALTLCEHFGECGGCLNQDVPYEEQVVLKQKALRELFQGLWDAPIPITPSPVLWRYRNKIDPSFALKWYPEPPPPGFQRDTVLGFKCRGKWFKPLDIEECRIGPTGLEPLLRGVRAWREAHELRACEPRRQQGYLRHLLVRDGKRANERMVVLLTMPGTLQAAEQFVAMVLDTFNATSIYHGEFAGRAEVATADTLTLLHGNDVIHETLCVTETLDAAPTYDAPEEFIAHDTRQTSSLVYRISPLSFFQTNPLAAERLYGHIRAWALQRSQTVLFDLYGGSGGIALSCADCADEIVSVENVASATEDGVCNARANHVENVAFVTDSVRNFLRQKVEGVGLPKDSVVVADPPRAGMHPKVIKRLIQLQPRRLLYVSCNPKRLREEAPAFLDSYRLADLRAVDMFPHTPHVEALAAFERIATQ